MQPKIEEEPSPRFPTKTDVRMVVLSRVASGAGSSAVPLPPERRRRHGSVGTRRRPRGRPHRVGRAIPVAPIGRRPPLPRPIPRPGRRPAQAAPGKPHFEKQGQTAPSLRIAGPREACRFRPALHARRAQAARHPPHRRRHQSDSEHGLSCGSCRFWRRRGASTAPPRSHHPDVRLFRQNAFTSAISTMGSARNLSN